jgi:hypothetical protein
MIKRAHSFLPYERWFAGYAVERQRTHPNAFNLRMETNYGSEGIKLYLGCNCGSNSRLGNRCDWCRANTGFHRRPHNVASKLGRYRIGSRSGQHLSN